MAKGLLLVEFNRPFAGKRLITMRHGICILTSSLSTAMGAGKLHPLESEPYVALMAFPWVRNLTNQDWLLLKRCFGVRITVST